jgi:hypothetical protein
MNIYPSRWNIAVLIYGHVLRFTLRGLYCKCLADVVPFGVVPRWLGLGGVIVRIVIVILGE